MYLSADNDERTGPYLIKSRNYEKVKKRLKKNKYKLNTFFRIIFSNLSLVFAQLGFIRHPSSGVFVEQSGQLWQSVKYYTSDSQSDLEITVDGDNYGIETDQSQILCGKLNEEITVGVDCNSSFKIGSAKWFQFILNNPNEVKSITLTNDGETTRYLAKKRKAVKNLKFARAVMAKRAW